MAVMEFALDVKVHWESLEGYQESDMIAAVSEGAMLWAAEF